MNPSAMHARIVARLGEVAGEEGVRVLFAVESGSRAWGWGSADSDYDVRFVYARRPAEYMALWPKRDVIERPLSEDLIDLSGWDIRKALLLTANGNAMLQEWLTSPIRYLADNEAIATIRGLLDDLADRRAAMGHYYGMAASQWRLMGPDGPGDVNLKRYLYAVRPAAAIRWLATRDDLPPMTLPDLLVGIDLDRPLRDGIADVVARRTGSSEIGRGPRIAVIDAFVTAMIAEAERRLTGWPKPDQSARRALFEAALSKLIGLT